MQMMSTEAERVEAVEGFACSLADLTVNSKPHINFLTMVAEENSGQAEAITKAVNEHLQKVPKVVKLPILYLIDSIMKNVGKNYIDLFTSVLVDCFANIYAEADKSTRHLMEKLRQTWNNLISSKELSTLDVQVHALDPGWPLTAESLDALKNTQVKILLNPNFLPQVTTVTTLEPKNARTNEESAEVDEAEVLREQLLLQKRMRDLEREQKQVDFQLSEMKKKIIIVNEIKECTSDAICYNEAKEKISDSTIILDVEMSENQADSTTVDKATTVSLSDSNPIVLTTASATEETPVSDKRLSGDLLQLLTDLIAKQNLKLKKQGVASHQKYQEHRSENRESSRTKNWTRYPESRSQSSHHRYRDRSSGGHHRYANQRDDRNKRKNHHKKVEHGDSEIVHACRAKDHSYRSPPEPSNRKNRKLDLKHFDKCEFAVPSGCVDLSNSSVTVSECSPASSEPDKALAERISPFDSRRNDEPCHRTSPKRKGGLSELGGAPPNSSPCVDVTMIPVEEQQTPVFGKNQNSSQNYFKRVLLPTPNVKDSVTVLESFGPISFVQSQGKNQNATNSIAFCHRADKLSYIHQRRECLYRQSTQCINSPIEIQMQRERDYNHGFKSAEKKQFMDHSIPNFESSREQPAVSFPSIPPTPPIENNLKSGNPMCSLSRQQELRQDFSNGGYQKNLLREEVENLMRSTRVNQDFTVDSSLVSLPPASPYLLDKIKQDTVEAILVDNSSRKIRFYGEVALIDSQENNLREISFKPAKATIIVNNIAVECLFHNPEREVVTCGKIFRVRLGAPTRELYVNDEWFQCQFNCPPKKIQLSTGEILAVQLHSNAAPLVHIGAERPDLVAGHVTLSIDAVQLVQIFLDAKPQRFDVDGVPHILKFADDLQTVLVNDYPVNMQFDGPPIVINVNNMNHYVQLSELPPGIIPGKVNIIGMTSVKKIPHKVCPVPLGINVSHEWDERQHSLQKSKLFARKARGKRKNCFKLKDSTASRIESPLRNQPICHPKINVHALFQSLCNVGLVTPLGVTTRTTENKISNLKVHTIDFKEPASLKLKQHGIVEVLYSGLQCSSCGLRFSTEHTEDFRKHLDLHFNENRTLRCFGKCHSRKWYCKKELWIQSEADGNKSLIETEHEVCLKEESSVPSREHPQGIVCELCCDKFEEFFNEDQDEWHLKDCMSHKGLVYHPICFKDCQMSRSGVNTLETKEDANNVILKISQNEKVHQQHYKKNVDSKEIFVIEVRDNDEQIANDSRIDIEKNPFISNFSSDMTLEQEVPQRPEMLLSQKCDTKNILSEKKLLEESQQSSCVTDTSSDPIDLIEMDDPETAAQCVEAAAAVSPSVTQVDMSVKPLTFCYESIKESDATIANDTIGNLLCPLEPLSGELELHPVLKPKLIGRKLRQLPPAVKGSETSNLCALS